MWGDAAHDSRRRGARSQKDFLSGGSGDDTLYAGRGTQHGPGRRRQRLPAGQRRLHRLYGGNGNDTIRLAAAAAARRRRRRRATTLITAITASGSGTVSCGPGNDTVTVVTLQGRNASAAMKVSKRRLTEIRRSSRRAAPAP